MAEQFDLYVDRKVVVWQREHHSVTAATREEAVQLLAEASKKNLLNGTSELSSYTGNIEYLVETESQVKPEDNDGDSTLEIADPANLTETLWSNEIPDFTPPLPQVILYCEGGLIQDAISNTPVDILVLDEDLFDGGEATPDDLSENKENLWVERLTQEEFDNRATASKADWDRKVQENIEWWRENKKA